MSTILFVYLCVYFFVFILFFFLNLNFYTLQPLFKSLLCVKFFVFTVVWVSCDEKLYAYLKKKISNKKKVLLTPSVTSYFFSDNCFFFRSLIDCGIWKIARRIKMISIEVIFLIATVFTVKNWIKVSLLFEMNNTSFAFYGDTSNGARIGKTLWKSQVLGKRE